MGLGARAPGPPLGRGDPVLVLMRQSRGDLVLERRPCARLPRQH